MKKFLIFLTILFSFVFSFLFIDNVGATVTESVSISQNTFKNYVLPLTNDMKSIRTTMLSNINYDSSTQDYFCLFNSSSGNPYGSCFVFNKNSGVTFGLKIYDYGSTASNHQLHYFFVLNNPNNSSVSYAKYKHNTSYTSQYGFTINGDGYNSSYNYSYGNLTKSGSLEVLVTNIDQLTYNNNNINVNSFNVYRYSWVEASINFKFFNNVNSSQNTVTTLNVYENSPFSTDNLINSFSVGDEIFDNNVNFIPSMPTPPTFTFLVNNNVDEYNRLISVDIRLNIADYTDDFIIQYVTDDVNGNWTTILPEYNQLTGYYFTWNNWSRNATIFVRAIYEQQVVSSGSQEISGIIPSYDSGQVNNFGNYSFGVTSNQVTISGENLFNQVVCSRDRNFVDNVCYVNNTDILNIQDKLSNKIHVNFAFSMHNINVPYQGDKFYLFTFRSYFSNIYLPFNISIISGNSINSTTSIIDYSIKEHGLYRDYIILFSSSSSQSLVAVDGVTLDFPNLSVLYDTFPDNFVIGFYNGVKYQQYDTQPTYIDIENFYNNNTIDSLNNDSLLSFFSNFNINDHGLSPIILKPVDFINNMLNTTCIPIDFPIPHTNKVITLPCIRNEFQLHLPQLFDLYQLIVTGLISYRIGLGLFRIIKNLFNPEDDKIEVIDL